MTATRHATLKKWSLIAAELLLVAIIIGLMSAIWLPALVGARDGVQ